MLFQFSRKVTLKGASRFSQGWIQTGACPSFRLVTQAGVFLASRGIPVGVSPFFQRAIQVDVCLLYPKVTRGSVSQFYLMGPQGSVSQFLSRVTQGSVSRFCRFYSVATQEDAFQVLQRTKEKSVFLLWRRGTSEGATQPHAACGSSSWALPLCP